MLFVYFYICERAKMKQYSSKMKRLLPGILLFSLLAVLGISTSSCQKEEGDYRLTVVVTVNDTTRVANANLRVYAPVSNTKIDYYDRTNEEGEFDYKFDNEVVVEIVATKGGFRACSFAEVERGDNTAKINLKPFGATDNGCLNTN